VGIGCHWLGIASSSTFLRKLWWNLGLCKTRNLTRWAIISFSWKTSVPDRISYVYCEPGHGRSLSGVTQERKVMMFITYKERTWLGGLQWRIRLEVRDVPCGLDSDQSPSGHNLQWIYRLLYYSLSCALTEPSLCLSAHRHQSLITRCLSLLKAELTWMFSSHFNSSLLYYCAVVLFCWNEILGMYLWSWYKILTELL
jgi:hypothetical protein